MAAPGPPTGTGFAQGTSGTVSPTAPATVNAGDILVEMAVSHQPVSVGTISWTAGYTEGQQVDIKNSSGTVIGRAGWAWKRAAGTEDGAAQAITRTGDTGTDSHFNGHCIAIPGCKTTGDPFETPPTPVNPNATTTVDWPSVTTSSAEACLILLHFSGGLNSNSGLPASWTGHESRGGTQGTDGALDIDYRQVTSAGTYDPANSTQTTDADHGHAQFQIAFIPDAAAQDFDLTHAAETDTAQALSFTKTIFKTLTAATETDAAQALTFDQGGAIEINLVPATEMDAAQAVAFTKTIRKTITPATETDAAQTVAFTKTIRKTLTPALETDVAQAKTFTKTIRKTLTPATETDQAIGLSVGGVNNVTITPATSSETARPLTFTKTIIKTLTPATEVNTAQGLSVTKTIIKTLTAALEADQAQVLIIAGIVVPNVHGNVVVTNGTAPSVTISTSSVGNAAVEALSSGTVTIEED